MTECLYYTAAAIKYNKVRYKVSITYWLGGAVIYGVVDEKETFH